jgi:hypothetical protein
LSNKKIKPLFINRGFICPSYLLFLEDFLAAFFDFFAAILFFIFLGPDLLKNLWPFKLISLKYLKKYFSIFILQYFFK